MNDPVDVGGILYFTALDPTNGAELWKSDGTPGGTTLVKDINPGSGDSFPGDTTNVGGTLYFHANDGTNGYELWAFDPTPPETTIDTGPTGTTSDPTPSFEFSSEPGADFECRVDADSLPSCTSPETIADTDRRTPHLRGQSHSIQPETRTRPRPPAPSPSTQHPPTR